MRTYKNFINGVWVEPKTDRFIDNVNPANTRDIIGKVPLSTREEARSAVDAAQAALETWSSLPAPRRGEYLTKALRLMEDRKLELGRALTREEGKILNESLGEVQKSLNVLEYIAGEGRRIGGVTRPSELPNTFCYTVRVPMGVCAVVTPWNFPVAIPVWKIAPALLSGNTVVFKPSSLTPECAVLVTEIFDQAGLPPGVLNLVLGSGSEAGQAILDHGAIKAISFTGSTEIGTRLYADAASRRIKVQCEMGGKNPIVVLADADLNLAVESTVQGAFGSTGQRCTATSRVVIEEVVADAFVTKLLKRMEQIKIGDGMDTATNMGPSVDANQMTKVLEYVEIGKKDGATLLRGGKRVGGDDCANGFFIQPTAFDYVTPNMRIAEEEIFGPVLSILRVKTFEDALKVANEVPFGLTSSIYTNDVGRIFRFVDKIETGITHINSPTMGGEAQLPFGGMKATGIGSREMNEAAFDFFTELKTVYIDYTGAARGTFIY